VRYCGPVLPVIGVIHEMAGQPPRSHQTERFVKDILNHLRRNVLEHSPRYYDVNALIGKSQASGSRRERDIPDGAGETLRARLSPGFGVTASSKFFSLICRLSTMSFR